jgi:hypothetical protein
MKLPNAAAGAGRDDATITPAGCGDHHHFSLNGGA